MGISNTPDQNSQANLQTMAVIGDLIYEAIGPFDITSGYRSPALNSALSDSSGTSLHMQGKAIDVRPLTMSPEAFFWKLAASSLRYSCGEIINETDIGVVHISSPYVNSLGQQMAGALKYKDGGSYYSYTPAEIRAKIGSSPSNDSSGYDFPSMPSASFDLPIIPIVLTAAVLGGIAFIAVTKRKAA